MIIIIGFLSNININNSIYYYPDCISNSINEGVYFYVNLGISILNSICFEFSKFTSSYIYQPYELIHGLSWPKIKNGATLYFIEVKFSISLKSILKE